MGSIIFWAVFAAVLVGLGIAAIVVRNKIRRMARETLGTDDFGQIMDAINEEGVIMSPKSVSGMDSLLLPRILEDFPDYDVNGAKNAVRDYLRRQLGNHSQLQIHKVVIARYLPTGMQKTVVFQAAVGWKEQGQTVQKRYDLHHCYSPDTATAAVAANCPNCGANLGYGVTACPYCGSRVVNVMGNTWKFAKIQES